MTNGLRKAISHSGVYGLGTVLSNMVSIVMLPVYTRYLTPADYGLLELLSMLGDVTGIIFGMRAFVGLMRYYFESEDESHRREVVVTSLLTGVGLHAAGAIVLIIWSAPLAKLFTGSAANAPALIVVAASLVTMALLTNSLAYLRALQRPWWFLGASMSKLFLQVGLNVLFVVVLRKGPIGVLWSTLIAGIIVGGSLATWTLTRTGLRFSRHNAWRLLRLGLPLTGAGIASFYTTYGDRFFLKAYWNLTEVGLYALAYRFGFALYSFIFTAFNQGWGPQAYQIYARPEGKRSFQRAFLLAMLPLIVAGTAMSMFAREILTIMSTPSFVRASTIVPVIVVAYVVKAATDFCSFGIVLKERTGESFKASVISLVIMTVGYLSLIPTWGGMGAAIATLTGMLGELWWVRRTSESLVPLDLPWHKVVSAAALGAVAFFTADLFDPAGLTEGIVWKLFVLMTFVAVVFFSPIVGQQERRACRELLRDALTSR